MAIIPLTPEQIRAKEIKQDQEFEAPKAQEQERSDNPASFIKDEADVETKDETEHPALDAVTQSGPGHIPSQDFKRKKRR